MDTTPTEHLVRSLVAGDPTAIGVLVERSASSEDPTLLVAAALVVPGWQPLLARADAAASDARGRQVVAIARAHLLGETDRTLLLARDHLADHPDSLLVAHIAASSRRR